MAEPPLWNLVGITQQVALQLDYSAINGTPTHSFVIQFFLGHIHVSLLARPDLVVVCEGNLIAP